ncbi:MAG: PASTA domain-containing protein [Candidatus Eremiobacteraeota bacterium]|nr:PASTA domain-containing protein [Candidatus Eremiobacteraeota bacterium]
MAVVVWFGRQIYDFLLPSSATVTLPSFVGQTLTDANAEIERLRLTAAVVDHTTSDRYPKNVVIMQRPEAGQQVRQGRQVSFVISDGIVARLMPDLRYQSMREVQLDLSHAHLQMGKVKYQRSDVIPEGHVISQSPAPLVSVHEGDAVNLVVSRGARLTIAVPKFVGLTIDQARDLAERGGIKLGQVVWTPLGKNGPPHGMVARQQPPPNAKIASYDPVDLQVSAGPNESGYLLRQVRVLVSVPTPQNVQNGQQLDIRLALTDATGQHDVYRAYAEPGQKLDLTVTAVGTSLLDMYVNDELVGETRLGTEPAKIYGNAASPSPTPL